MLTIPITPDRFSLVRTLNSGQCFRFTQNTDGSFRVFSKDRVCDVWQTEESVMLSSSQTTADTYDYWTRYFSLAPEDDEYYEGFLNVMQGNPILEASLEQCRGVRILKQDPWETLICFVVSQQKRIPQIKACVNKICEAATTFALPLPDGSIPFPTPHDLTVYSLDDAKLGFRQRYIYRIAQEVDRGYFNLDRLYAPGCSYEHARSALCYLDGVGTKIANCVCLFALGHRRAFPVDVHIQRILDKPEMRGFNKDKFGDYAGLVQQYLYAYAISHSGVVPGFTISE